MPCSGLSLVMTKHANEMGTSELHRTSIKSVATALMADSIYRPPDPDLGPSHHALTVKLAFREE